VNQPPATRILLRLVISVAGVFIVAWPAMASVLSVQAEPVEVMINEVLASNTESLADPQGEYDDWIELYNPSGVPVNVGGMYLTDDQDEPTKWQFPTNRSSLTTIPARGYLLVWADGEMGDSGLHAGFKLSADGDAVALFDRDGETPIDSIRFDAQTADISYGRLPNAPDAWARLTFPTPGAANVQIYQGFVERPQFGPEHGFYDSPIFVTITCATEGATIYYTTDGSEPYSAELARRGSTAALYTTPVRVAGTTCLRAAAVKFGWKTSPMETSTYIFVSDVATQSPHGQRPGAAWPTGSVSGQVINYGMDPDVVNDTRYRNLIDDALLAIPSLSLVTDLANLFDPKTGIYVHARNQGLAWERPVSVELLHPDGTDGFQIDAGLRIRGGYSRSGNNPKHAFRLFFRAEYGAAKLRYPLFGHEGVDEFENMDLRTSQNYSWSFEGGNRDTFVREVFSRDTQRDMGQPYTRSRYYHLYIDGHYWGLYQTQERSEASYAETYFGGEKEDYDVVKSRAGNGGYDIEATDGTLDAWRRLWDATISGFDEATYYRVQGLNADGTPDPAYEKLLDVDNLIDYMLCTYYVGDPDGPVSAWARVANNFYTIFNRVEPDGFTFFRHDAEHSLWELHESRLFAATTVAVGSQFRQSNPLWLHTHLMLHPEYRMRFVDRTYRHFFNGGVLTPGACIQRFNRRVAEVDMAIIAESARWGDAKRSTPRTRDSDWRPDINRMVTNYFPQRTGVVLNQLKAQGWYPNVNPPSFSRQGGQVSTGFALQMQGAGEVRYTLDGTDPRLPETAGRTITTRTLVAPNASKRVLVPTSVVSTAWKGGGTFNDSTWTVVTGLPGGVGYERNSGYESLIGLDVGSQMYQGRTSCYIRIPFNLSTDPDRFDFMNLKVRYDDGFVAYLNGVEIQRVLFSGAPRWNSRATANHEADGVESFSVSDRIYWLKQGQNILAIHGLNVSSTSSDFLISVSLEAGETTGGQAGGIAETATRYAGPITLDRSTHIKARTLSGGTWSALTEAVFALGPVAEDLRISEIMFHPADPNTEFIELTNVGLQTINLNLVRFTDGIEYVFPSFELPVGGYCLLVRDIPAFETKYGTELPVLGQYAGSLSNGGEQIELVDAIGTVIHSFEYDDKWFDPTDGLGFSLTVKDPQTADPEDFDYKNLWRPSVLPGGSPGEDDSHLVPELDPTAIGGF